MTQSNARNLFRWALVMSRNWDWYQLRPGERPAKGRKVPGQGMASLGFTLIEGLVAMALGLVVLLALAETYSSAMRLHGALMAKARLLERMHIAEYFLQAGVNQAGAMGCVSDFAKVAKFLNAPWSVLSEYDLTSAVVGIDAAGSKDLSGSGYASYPIKNGSGVLRKATAGINAAKLAEQADMLVLRGFGDLMGYLDGAISDDTASFTANEAGVSPETDDIALVSDCFQAALFRVRVTSSSASGGFTLSWPDGAGDLDNALVGTTTNGASTVLGLAQSASGLRSEARVYLPSQRVFFVAKSSAVTPAQETVYALWQKVADASPVELVSGVSDMQVLYGVALNPGASAVAPDKFGYYSWDSIPAGGQILSLWVVLVLQDIDHAAEHLFVSPETTVDLSFALPRHD